MQTDDSQRYSGAVLAFLTVAALVVGVGWWVSAAPAGVPRPELGGSPVVGEESDWSPEAGSPPVTDGAGIVVLGESADNRLPQFAGTVRREVWGFDSDDWQRWAISTDSGARFLVQFVCVGNGVLEVRLGGVGPEGRRHRLSCGDTFESVDVTAAEDTMTVAFRRIGPGPVEAAVQIVAVP
ncbi:hypothetical protein [Polymorphospora lycopeni]|uniref:Secreted protein n=1 Tax=Polymorphospora lycopeni TaxID=3140240 RepID=A0ABV5CVE9_9ACTN